MRRDGAPHLYLAGMASSASGSPSRSPARRCSAWRRRPPPVRPPLTRACLRRRQDRPDPGLDPARSGRHGRQADPAGPALDRPALPDLRHRRLLGAAARRRARRLRRTATSKAPITTTASRSTSSRWAAGVKCDAAWAPIGRLALWAEPLQNQPAPPFRWVGYDGDAGHGCGNHLHLSWNHSPVAQFQLAEWVETFPVSPGETVGRPRGKRSPAPKPPPGPAGGISTVRTGGVGVRPTIWRLTAASSPGRRARRRCARPGLDPGLTRRLPP